MLARLWWKEYRVFRPVWLVMILAAAGLQWLLLTRGTTDIRLEALTQTALIWPVLYAFAVGAAAFAGEREAKTIGFLDALPVDRRMLWLGKATFSLATAYGLGLVLAGLAALGTLSRDPIASPYGKIILTFATLTFEAAAWGLFWSAISRNTLLAGAMAVVSVAVVALTSNRMVPIAAADEWKMTAIHLFDAVAALAGSAVVVAWRPHEVADRWADRWGRSADRPATIAVRRASAGRGLVWQTWREGWTTVVLVVLVGLVLPVGFAFLGEQSEGGFLTFAVVASLVAGVSVFGTENASGSRPFLVQHGVAPGMVWGRKMMTWGAVFVALALLSCMLLGSSFPGPQFARSRGPWDQLAPFAAALFDAFAVGVFCGMTIRRRITAGLVSVMGLLAVAPLQIGMQSFDMIPPWSLFLTPLILLAITRAWAGDWLLDRDGFRPWVRLGLLTVVPFGLLGGSYVAYRAYGVPDVGPQFDPSSVRARAIPPDRDAVTLYRGANSVIHPWGGPAGPFEGNSASFGEIIGRGWDPKETGIVGWWDRNRAAIDLARRASALPAGPFAPAGRMTFATGHDGTIENFRWLGWLLALDARERQSRGDLAGMWDDILALFRMANQVSATTPTLIQMLIAAQVHHQAVGLAFDWLGDPRQVPDLTRRALADLKALPPLPSLAESLRVESSIIDRTLDLPPDELGRVLNSTSGDNRGTPFWQFVFAQVVAPSWERQRARRVCRRIVAQAIPQVELEPWRRDPSHDVFERSDRTFGGSMLVRMFFPNVWSGVYQVDRETVGRRALVQAVAIRVWRLDHGENDNETLEALVPGLLDRLPLDPYSGRPFGYVKSAGQSVRPPIASDFGPPSSLRPTRPGQWLLYSVGPDKRDDGGKAAYSYTKMNEGDYLFAVP